MGEPPESGFPRGRSSGPLPPPGGGGGGGIRSIEPSAVSRESRTLEVELRGAARPPAPGDRSLRPAREVHGGPSGTPRWSLPGSSPPRGLRSASVPRSQPLPAGSAGPGHAGPYAPRQSCPVDPPGDGARGGALARARLHRRAPLTASHRLAQLRKRSVSRPRPQLPAGVSSLAEVPDRFSVPSGPAAAALSLALPTSLALPVAAGALLLGVACLVGVSRCHLGVHDPGDVGAGWLLAMVGSRRGPLDLRVAGNVGLDSVIVGTFIRLPAAPV